MSGASMIPNVLRLKGKRPVKQDSDEPIEVEAIQVIVFIKGRAKPIKVPVASIKPPIPVKAGDAIVVHYTVTF